ncbi:MAG: hypothetical protein WCK37_03025 [Candidatus Falkowbacteria bacterium]
MVFFENPNFIIFNLPMNVSFRGISMIWNIPIIFIFTATIAVMVEHLEPKVENAVPDDHEKDKLKKSSMFFLAYIIGAVGIGLFCALISISVSIMACCLIMIIFFGLATLIGFFVEGLFLALGILIGSVVGMFFVAYIHFWPMVIILITTATLKFVKFIVPKLCF